MDRKKLTEEEHMSSMRNFTFLYTDWWDIWFMRRWTRLVLWEWHGNLTLERPTCFSCVIHGFRIVEPIEVQTVESIEVQIVKPNEVKIVSDPRFQTHWSMQLVLRHFLLFFPTNTAMSLFGVTSFLFLLIWWDYDNYDILKTQGKRQSIPQ